VVKAINVAQYVAKFLVEKNVRHVFGFQGGAILKLLDEMVATDCIEYVQNYHEQASAFCADAYSRVTRNLGVALATSGPGATNLVTGIANAQLDSIPTLFITGQDYLANVQRENGSRQNGFQDLNIIEIVRPITKYAALVDDGNRIRYELEKAYWLAKSGRPGAVLLDIPIDIQFQEINIESLKGFDEPIEEPGPFSIEIVVDCIKAASRPVIVVGGGVQLSDAQDELGEFIRISGIPVVSTLNGLDAYAGRYGFAGLHGNTFANLAVQNADLVLALGCRFGQRQVGKVPSTYTYGRVVHVDIDEHELNRIFDDEIAIKADLGKFLQVLNQCLSEEKELPNFLPWEEIICEWKRKYKSKAYLNADTLDPVRVVEELSSLFSPSAIITNDVGQNQMWVAQGMEIKTGQRILNSSGLGSMGYSLPAAIGAKFAYPDRQVISFTGDGGLQMNLQEFMLIGHRRVGVKCFVFNNNTLGMMREVQARYYNKHYYGANEQEFRCVELEKLANTYGINYRRVTSVDEVAGLHSILEDEMPWIVELVVATDSKLSNRYDEASIFEQERIQ
jgi:acetolactate synthase-1/2/3 large subunit